MKMLIEQHCRVALLVFSVLLVSAGASCGGLSSQLEDGLRGTITIQGRVVDEEGNAMPDAQVNWKPITLGWYPRRKVPEYREVEVDKDGVFRVKADGFAAIQVRVFGDRQYYARYMSFYATNDQGEFERRVQAAAKGEKQIGDPRKVRQFEVVMYKKPPVTQLVSVKGVLEYRSDGSGVVVSSSSKENGGSNGDAPIRFVEVEDVNELMRELNGRGKDSDTGDNIGGVLALLPQSFDDNGKLVTRTFAAYTHAEHGFEWIDEWKDGSVMWQLELSTYKYPHDVSLVAAGEGGIQRAPSLPKSSLFKPLLLPHYIKRRMAPVDGYDESAPWRLRYFTTNGQDSGHWVRVGGCYGFLRGLRRRTLVESESEKRKWPAIMGESFVEEGDGWTLRAPVEILVQPDGSGNMREEYFRLTHP